MMNKRFLIASACIAVVSTAMIVIFLTSLFNLETNTRECIFREFTHHNSLKYLMIFYVVISAILPFCMYKFFMKPIEDIEYKLKTEEKEQKKDDKYRSEFVANVTHELKTPLTSISGFVETLQDGAIEDPEARKKFIDIIAVETARLNRLLDDLIVLSDIESRKIIVRTADIDVKESLENLILMVAPLAESKNIKLIKNLDSGCIIEGNQDRFVQMMLNLVENAIKYSKDIETQEAYVKISCHNVDGNVLVDIEDNGIGIAEEHFDRLFERFYRVDKSRSQKAGGTGLGLSIVKHLAFFFNAEVSVKSKLGEGTTFSVVFKQKGV